MKQSATCRAIPVTFVAWCLLLVAQSLSAGTGNDKCVDKLNNDGRKVLGAEHKKNTSCIKDGSGDITACIDAVGAKTIVKQDKTISDDMATCTPPPAFAYAGAAVVNSAAQQAANGIVHDLFGPVVTVGTTAQEKMCQEKVADASGKLAITKWKLYRKCKKDGLAGFADAGALATACLGGPAGPQPDPKSLIAKRKQKLEDVVQSKCVDTMVALSVFAGECAGETTAAGFSNCADARVECQLCRAIKAADAFLTMHIDCDLFDDGVANASCASGDVPTPTPTLPPVPPTPTDTPTPTNIATDTPTNTPSNTPTNTGTNTPLACVPPDCNDGLQCTDDTCDPLTGECDNVFDSTNCGSFPSCAEPLCGIGRDCQLEFHHERCPSHPSGVTCLAPLCTGTGCSFQDICGPSHPDCGGCPDCSCSLSQRRCVKTCPS